MLHTVCPCLPHGVPPDPQGRGVREWQASMSSMARGSCEKNGISVQRRGFHMVELVITDDAERTQQNGVAARPRRRPAWKLATTTTLPSSPCSTTQPELTRFLLHDTYAVAFVHGGTFAGGAFPQHTNLPGRRSREGRLPWQHGRRVPGTATTGPGTRPDALLVAGRRVE
jgi:hypothetical protein